MAGPSLSEIQSYKGDANIGAAAGGANITEVNTGSSLPYIQAASTMVAQAAKEENDLYQKNIESTLSGLGTINTTGIMDADRPALVKEYGTYLQDLYKDFDVVRNPMKNGELSGQLKQREAVLRANLEQSRSQRALLEVSRKQLRDNPAWATEENKEAIRAYEAKPIAERGELYLKPPFVVAIEPMAAIANKAAEVKTASSDLVKNGKYIQTQKGSFVDPAKFDENILSQLNSQDGFGRQLRQGWQNVFSAMPEEEQAKYSGLDDFVLKNARAHQGMKQVTESKLDENQVALQQSSQAFQAGQNAMNRKLEQQRIDLQSESMGKGKVNLDMVGRYKNELLANLFTTGSAPLEVLQDIYGDDTKVEKTVVDMIPNPLDPSLPKIKGGTSKKINYPKLQITGSRLVNGELVIDAVNNETGAKSTIKKSAAQANSDFNNILGKERASAVSEGSSRFLKNNGKSENFNVKEVQEIFDMAPKNNNTVPKQTNQGGYSNIRSANGKQIGVKDGKWFDIQTGKELK